MCVGSGRGVHGFMCPRLAEKHLTVSLELSVHAANLRYQGHHKTMFEYGEYSYVVICKRFS
jgi:hypothetical protein